MLTHVVPIVDYAEDLIIDEARICQGHIKRNNLVLNNVGSLRILGEACWLDGLDISMLVYDGASNELSFTISPGRAVIDDTLIGLDTSTDVTIEMDGYTSGDEVLIMMRFGNYQEFQEMDVCFTVFSRDASGDLTPADEFSSHRDRLLLAHLTINTATLDIALTAPDSDFEVIVNSTLELAGSMQLQIPSSIAIQHRNKSSVAKSNRSVLINEFTSACLPSGFV